MNMAFRNIKAGDTVFVSPGTYSGSAGTTASGTTSNPITIIGPNDNSAIITGRWTIRHSNYVIKGFHFKGVDLQLRGTGANNNIISSNKFSKHRQGVYMLRDDANNNGVNGPSYNTIKDNEFTDPIGNGSVVTFRYW